ncbi:thrombospondin type 3 repeat-containing protein [Catenovulum sp. SM1970]|uniref:thrombospondin type 3 repeat-containing protein n=1 Tax=Marinifaba aquimaris TaxID=2741323 RepID=UPI001571B0D6|nr:thrombospondin type 3 repeat-containing protein [Marinifaba aquimaris]NTS76117.1 thrombospondin type 3 repeat-containing protein [Marinifaba aquimaris]
MLIAASFGSQANIDPTGLAYTPDDVFIDKNNDTVYLSSQDNNSIFRWSITEKRYLDTISLEQTQAKLAYSAAHDRIYLLQRDNTQQIDYIDISDDSVKPFLTTEFFVSTLSSVSDSLFVRQSTSSWGRLSAYDINGAETLLSDQIEPTQDYLYHPIKERVYYLSNFSPADLNWMVFNADTNYLGYAQDSSYHDSEGWSHNIKPSESGHQIALGSGRVVSGTYMVELTNLSPNEAEFTDVEWVAGNIITLSGNEDNTISHINRYNADFTLNETDSFELAAKPVALEPISNNSLLVVSLSDTGIPQLTTYQFVENDFDNDGVIDEVDIFPKDATESQDADFDGTGDNADLDDDNDGVPDTQDDFPFDYSESKDSDNDGIGNNLDTDDDNDGVLDENDAFPEDATRIVLNATDFLPLTSGSTWQYDSGLTVNLANNKQIYGQSITPISFSSGSQMYLSAQEDSLVFNGLYIPGLNINNQAYDVDIELSQGFDLTHQGGNSGIGRVDIDPIWPSKCQLEQQCKL